MYALAGKVFSITSPPPFSGSKRHPGYLDFNGPSASDIIKWIVEKIFDRLEQGSINSSERKSKRTKKEVDVLEFVVKSFNEVVKETGKDWMDDLVLRGLTRTGHYLVQGRAIIPKYLRADGGVVGKKTTKKMMPVTPSRCSSEKRGREGGGQEESVARKKQKELLDSVGGQSKQIEASYLPSNSSASLVYHGYNYPGASRYPPQYIRFDAPLMHPPVPYGWPNGHHHSYSSYHYLPHTFHSLNLNSDNPLPPSPIPSSSPPLIKTELSLGHNPYVAPTSTSSSIYTSEIPLPTIQSLPPFPPKQTFSTQCLITVRRGGGSGGMVGYVQRKKSSERRLKEKI
ncbi:hypothetical protein BC829DRAFT_418905 [Chytridium lagenaria]|nr:hypothetical protein BC829DRAFT_418905 [Chytridium lagenaria]